MEFLEKIDKRLLAVNYFRKKSVIINDKHMWRRFLNNFLKLTSIFRKLRFLYTFHVVFDAELIQPKFSGRTKMLLWGEI